MGRPDGVMLRKKNFLHFLWFASDILTEETFRSKTWTKFSIGSCGGMSSWVKRFYNSYRITRTCSLWFDTCPTGTAPRQLTSQQQGLRYLLCKSPWRQTMWLSMHWPRIVLPCIDTDRSNRGLQQRCGAQISMRPIEILFKSLTFISCKVTRAYQLKLLQYYSLVHQSQCHRHMNKSWLHLCIRHLRTG